MGHVFIIHSDIRKLCCDAWLLPCDFRARPNRQWLEWPPGAAATLPRTELPADWHPERRRTLKLGGWPAAYPQPWLTNVGADKVRNLDWFILGAVQFIEAAAKDLAARGVCGGQRPRPLLALPVVGTGFGGAESLAGDVVRLLIPALTESARRHQLDIALVAYDDHTFAAAQAYRRARTDSWRELPEPLRSHADRLAALAARGDLVLFLGAGVSTGANLPLWGELLEQLAQELGIRDAELRRAAAARLPGSVAHPGAALRRRGPAAPEDRRRDAAPPLRARACAPGQPADLRDRHHQLRSALRDGLHQRRTQDPGRATPCAAAGRQPAGC